jgi:hypothetical protein
LQDHLRDVEQRIRPAGHLDLPRQGFNALFFGPQAEVNLNQRWRGWAAFAWFATAELRPLATEWPAALAFGPWRAASWSGWAATIAARAIVVPSGSGWTVAAGRAGATAVAVAAAVVSLGFAFVFGVLGGGRLLRPRGEKEFVQV